MRIGLLSLTVLLSAAFPALADDAEDRAVEAVTKLGGRVVRDGKDPAKPVVSLNCRGANFSDENLKEVLSGLKGLRTLNLGATKVTDAGLKELAALKDLETLHLCYTGITDAGVKELAGLKNLKTLGLLETKVTDAGLKELAGLENLQTLLLYRTKVTAEGAAELKQALPKLNIRR